MNTGAPFVNAKDLLFKTDEKLIELLRSLSPSDWQLPTIAPEWKVKDIIAHLLDGNIRILSMLRDGYFGEVPEDTSYHGMVRYLNGLNADWVKAMKRVSPGMLIFLHEQTGPYYCKYYASLNDFDISPFRVDWAGEQQSYNWMHIAREYTEKWLHQQQIREAVKRPGLMEAEFFEPFMDIFMLALPYTLRDVKIDEGTQLRIILSGELNKSWNIKSENKKWIFVQASETATGNEVVIPSALAWKLFSKSLRPEQIMENITIRGNRELALSALMMVSVMA